MEAEAIELSEIISNSGERTRLAFDMQGVVHLVEQHEQEQPSTSQQCHYHQSGAQGSQCAESVENTSKGQDEKMLCRMDLTGNQSINFTLPKDPAPHGSECLIYLVRNICCFASGDGSKNPFYGELSGENELLLLNFSLNCRSGSEYFDLRISDNNMAHLSEHRYSLAQFQQAEILLQFITPGLGEGETVVIHEEPAFRLALDSPPWKWRVQTECRGFMHINQQGKFSVLCSNVFPVEKLKDVVEMRNHQFMVNIRIYFKLIQGPLDVLHGIQKCFHPEKSLCDLRDVMAYSLVSGENSDIMLVASDNVGYKVHRSILAANSNVYKAAFQPGMKESKARIMKTPPFVDGKVLGVFLKFVYARNRADLEFSPVLTMQVLQFAHLYNVDLLVEVCEESLLAMPIELFSVQNCLQIFRCAYLIDRAAIKTKIVHVLMLMDVRLSSSDAYIAFLQTHPEIAANMTEMIMEFQTSQFKN